MVQSHGFLRRRKVECLKLIRFKEEILWFFRRTTLEGDKTVEITLMKISEWMETEEPMMSGRTGYDDMQDDHLSPDGEYSTELGEVPAEDQKGSIKQHNLFAPYLYGRYMYE